MKGYKAFDKDLKCRDMQYKVGQEYKMDDEPILLVKGFHFCKNLKNLSRYCNLKNSRICEVEALGEIQSDSKKSVTNWIRIIRELKPPEVQPLLTIKRRLK